MHENVDITRELQESKKLLDNILLVEGSSHSKGGESTETQLLDIAADILAKVVAFFIPLYIIVFYYLLLRLYRNSELFAAYCPFLSTLTLFLFFVHIIYFILVTYMKKLTISETFVEREDFKLITYTFFLFIYSCHHYSILKKQEKNILLVTMKV